VSICATVGRPIQTRCDVCIHDGFVVFERPYADQDFLYYLLCELEPKWASAGQTGSQMNLNTSIIKSEKVILPRDSAEQRSIACALSDADGLVESLERLLTKKRRLKLGAMQQLLTPTRRLPGFEGEWETRTLGKVGVFSKGRGIKRDQVIAEGLACIRYGELYTRYDNYVHDPVSRIPVSVADASLPIRQGDILFAGSGETAEEIGRCAAYLGVEAAYAGGDIIVLTPAQQDSMFLAHLLNHSTAARQKARMGQGNAVVHIHARNLAQMVVSLPSLSEQRAIATVLSDMDAEITALEAKLVKARQIKQGMMQQLLTGRIRLV